jgi:hypothetical protein
VAFEDDDELGDEDATGLRKQLGKLGKENKALSEKLARFELKDMLTSKGFDLVKPDELVGVDVDQREKRAEELQTERRGMQEELLRKALGPMVEDTDALEGMVNDLLGKRSEQSEQAEQFGRAKELSGLESLQNPIVDPRQLHTEDAITYALSQKSQRKS